MEISWLDASDQVIKEIRNLDVYKRLEKLRKQLHKDKEVRALLKDFEDKKQSCEKARSYGKYYPRLKEISKEYSTAKTNLLRHPLIVEEMELTRHVQKILDNISMQIGRSVSSKIKVPNELGIIPRH